MFYELVSINGIWKSFVELNENQHSFPGIGIRSYSSNVKTKEETNVTFNSTESPKYEDRQTKSHYRFIYPEFLPDPDPKYRHPIREKIERQDMLKRR